MFLLYSYRPGEEKRVPLSLSFTLNEKQMLGRNLLLAISARGTIYPKDRPTHPLPK